MTLITNKKKKKTHVYMLNFLINDCSGVSGGGGGGGKGGDFMYSYHNFSFSRQKRMLKPFVHTSFSIRVFWERRDM